MTQIFFTSDLHLGHRLVANRRGFGDDIDAHDAAIAQRWIDTVGPKDTVWVLGDLCLTSPTYALNLVKQLPGTKHLVAGNHDACHPMHRQAHRFQRVFMEAFESVQPFARRRIAGQDVLLSHFPYSRDRHETRYTQYRLVNEGRWLLHGHTHGTERLTVKEDGAVPSHEIHVGVDAWDLTPISIDQVYALMKGAAFL